jgi:hypothetical protein
VYFIMLTHHNDSSLSVTVHLLFGPGRCSYTSSNLGGPQSPAVLFGCVFAPQRPPPPPDAFPPALPFACVFGRGARGATLSLTSCRSLVLSLSKPFVISAAPSKAEMLGSTLLVVLRGWDVALGVATPSLPPGVTAGEGLALPHKPPGAVDVLPGLRLLCVYILFEPELIVS